MADIRINALTSTAATTASDDYLAVDGSANGTRKLSAFSPTFGGNLTVSGSAPHTFNTTTSDAGISLLNGSVSNNVLVRVARDGGLDAGVIAICNGGSATTVIKGTGASTIGGNLTVSGITTLNSYLQAGAALAFPGALSTTNYYLYASSTLGAVLYGYGSNYDVHIANRSGARAISVDANTTNVGIGGNLTVSGAINAVGQSIVVSPSSGTAKGRINSDPFRADVIQVGSNWTGGTQDDATKPSWYWFFDSRVAGDAATLFRVPAGGSSTSALAISSTAATFAGNLTVSGGTITGGTSGMSLASGGTNQNLSITPSGTGRVHIAKSAGQDSYIELAGNGNTAGTSSVVIGQSGADLGVLYNRKNAALSFGTNGTEVARFFANGNLFVGASPVDGGQKLQVAGTGYLSDSLRVGTSWSPLAWGVKAIEVNDAGGGLFAAYYNGTAKGYIIANSGDFAINTQGANSLLLRTNGNTALTLTSAQQVQVNATTASTSTTTGALVVSGGVGVGGNITANNIIAAKPAGGWAQLEAQAPAANTSAAVDFVPAGTVSYSNPTWFVGHRFSAQGPLSFWAYNGSGHENNALSLTTAGNATLAGNLTVSGTQNVFGLPASASVLSTNSTMTFELTSNTSLTIKVRGTDGITRSASLTLA